MDSEARQRKRVWDRLVLRRKRGWGKLDEVLPDWRTHVDPEVLDMGDHHLCVLGQQPGGYRKNVIALTGSTRDLDTHRWAVSHGLEIKPVYDEAPGMDPYEALTRTWKGALLSVSADRRR